MTPLVQELFDLTGRVAIITGAARGIGLETARLLSASGAAVVLVDRDADALRAATASLEDLSGAVLAIEADITEETALDELFARVESWRGAARRTFW